MKTIGLELAMLIRGGRVLWTAAIFALVITISATVAWIGNHATDRDKASVAQAERERWLNQTGKDPHKAAHYSIYAFKPSLPLHALDPGIQPFVGQAVWLEPHWQNDMIYRPLQGAEPFQRMGLPNAAKFLIEFSPLLVFLVAFAAVAPDREQGALRLALGTALRPSTFVWGKYAAVLAFSCLALLLPALVIGLGSTLGSPTVDNVLRFAGWGMTMLIYLATLSALGVAMCLNAPSARSGFAVLLGLWIVMAFIAPRAASTSAIEAVPLPSYEGVKLQIEQEAPIYWTAETATQQTKEIMNRYGVTDVKDLPVDLRGALLDYNERHSFSVFDRLLGGFYDLVERQDLVFAALTWMSPAISAYATSAAITGTNFAQHRDFIDYAENYRRNLLNSLNAELMKGSAAKGSGVYKMSDFVLSQEMYAEIPEFKYPQPAVHVALKSAGMAPVTLVIWFMAGLGLIVWASRRVRA